RAAWNDAHRGFGRERFESHRVLVEIGKPGLCGRPLEATDPEAQENSLLDPRARRPATRLLLRRADRAVVQSALQLLEGLPLLGLREIRGTLGDRFDSLRERGRAQRVFLGRSL